MTTISNLTFKFFFKVLIIFKLSFSSGHGSSDTQCIKINGHEYFLNIVTDFVISFIVHIPVEIKVFFFCLATALRNSKFVIKADGTLLYLKLNFLRNFKLSTSKAEKNKLILIFLQNFFISLNCFSLNSIFFIVEISHFSPGSFSNFVFVRVWYANIKVSFL